MTDALRWGVQPEYRNAAGRLVRSPDETVDAVLAALGAAQHREPGPPGALILHPGDPIEGRLSVLTEDGNELLLEGSVGADAPLGYHTFDAPHSPRSLIICPRRCHLPAGLRQGGWAVQVYAARSRTSWGIGDLGDVRALGEWAAAHGAGFVLLSPLNAAAPSPPVEPSPYLPSSRCWRNPLYLRVEEVPGAAAVLGADLAAIVAAGRALNADRRIDRDAVAVLKLATLRRIADAGVPSPEFASWRRAQGERLERFATFSAIAEDHGGDFREWPPALRDCESETTRRVSRTDPRRVEFHAWLQWLLDNQLSKAAAALPLMTDLPIGVDPGGADVWADPGLFARDFSVGAPADEFNTLGQDWAQPPWNPWILRSRGYAPLISVLRAAFAHAMGLRIDHIMGLFRLYWIPRDGRPASGVFVRYPASDLLDIVALESVRAGAVVVGEDLGTVEPMVRDEMAARDILSYRLLWFEDDDPASFPRRAMSALTTHDLPTVAGVWSGADAEARRSLGLPVNEAGNAEIRQRLARVAGDAGDSAAIAAVNAYRALTRSPSMLVAAALEDAAGVAERPNMPGTTSALWPNWSLALPRPLDEVMSSPVCISIAEALRRTD